MSHKILLTGASGYLGGDLLPHLTPQNIPSYSQLFALVRTHFQAAEVKKYGAEPLTINLQDEKAVYDGIVEKGITVVFYLVDSLNSEAQVFCIKALAEVKKRTGGDVHFLHTTGAKIFSSHAGAPTDRPLLDTEEDLYDIQKAQKPPSSRFATAVATNNIVIEEAEARGVRSYIFAPCIVYGKSLSFGNPISIQTVAIVRAAQALRRVYSVDAGRPTWPVCHVADNSFLYLAILRSILAGENPGWGKRGYYLAASGSVAWEDIYATMAKAMKKRGVINDESVGRADDEVLEKMGKLLGVPKNFVGVMLGGK